MSPRTVLPAMANLAAIALLGIVGAYWTWQWIAPAQEARISPRAESLGDIAAATDLFGAGPAATVAAGEGRNGLRLAGVVAAREDREAYAVIIVDGQGIVATRRGEEVVPGARLVEVAPDHIVVDRQGVRESLALPEKSAAPESASQRKGR